MPGPSAQGGNAGAEQCWGTMDDVRGCVCWMGSEVVSDGVMREPVLCEEVLDPGRMGSGPPVQTTAPPRQL